MVEIVEVSNYGQPVSGQTGRLFLPFDATIGRKFAGKLGDVARGISSYRQRLSGL
jgi:hypothetical protein